MKAPTPELDLPERSLRTERLLLRAWRDSDRVPFARMNADPRVAEHLPSILTAAESDAIVARFREHWDAYGFGPWVVEIPAEAAFVGFAGLLTTPFDAHFTPAVEAAWRLVPEVWGRGYATEAAAAAIRDGFERLGLEEIVAFTVPANVRSRRVMEKLGMRRSPEEDFDHPRVPEGHPLRRHHLHRLRRE